MELGVFWTEFAETKLQEIYIFYKQHNNELFAIQLIDELIDASITLEKSPFIGQKELNLENRPQSFRYIIHKNYKIIYWINNKKARIEIVNVFDTRQNPDKLLETSISKK